MSDNLLYKIALSKVKGLGATLTKNVVVYIGDLEAVFKEKPHALEKIPGIGRKLAYSIGDPQALSEAAKELNFVIKHNIQLKFYLDNDYPARLKQCGDAPVIIYHKGQHTLSDKKMLAVVGTRNISERGKENCNSIIKELALSYSNLTIVSGLAYGVDICAHRAALEYHIPTISVLAHGLDRVYPSLHKHTALELLKEGAQLTEFGMNTSPDRQNFVRRNRIIAGLTDATLVVESAEKGGSLITAKIAQSYNRDVLAIPGRVDDVYSKGCNALIKSNVAALVEDAKDIAYALNWEEEKKGNEQLSLFSEPEGDKGLVYHLLRQEKELSLSTISSKTKLNIPVLSSLLLGMEMDGLIKSVPGNRFRCLH